MNLISFKIVTASLIFLASLIAGIASLRFLLRHQRALQLGDALANGIFIGVALFHLLPGTLDSFNAIHLEHAYGFTLLLAMSTALLLWALQQAGAFFCTGYGRGATTFMAFVTISIHAIISGAALGISDTTSLASILFIAIITHKGFEAFALTINLSRSLPLTKTLAFLVLFSLATPLGIALGTAGERFVSPALDNYLTACFNALAAGTFFYIGAMHAHHKFPQKSQDTYYEYTQILAMLVGMGIMGVLAIWV